MECRWRCRQVLAVVLVLSAVWWLVAGEDDAGGDQAALQQEMAMQQDGADGQQQEGEAGQEDGGGQDEAAPVADAEEIPQETFVKGIKILARGNGMDRGTYVFWGTAVDMYWHNCSATTDGVLNSECHSEDEFSDRMTFEILLDRAENYEVFVPIVFGKDLDAEPEVSEFAMDADNSGGEFTVLYNCRSSGFLNVEVTVPFKSTVGAETRELVIKFSWVHHCEGGEHEYVALSFYDERKGLYVHEFPEGKPLVVDKQSQTTQLAMTLLAPARSQGFGPVTLTSSSSVVIASVKPTRGVLHRLDRHSLMVAYQCAGEEVAQIKLVIPIPPFNPIVATWEKRCTSALGPNVQIDLAHDGTLLYLTGSVKEVPKIVVPKNQTHLDLKITNRDSYDPVVIKAPALTAWRSDVLLPQVHLPGIEESLLLSFVPPAGMAISPESESILRVYLACKTFGNSDVLLSIPFQTYKSFDLVFGKQCTHPPHDSSRFSGLVVPLISLILLLAIGAIFWRRKQRSGKKIASAMQSLKVQFFNSARARA